MIVESWSDKRELFIKFARFGNWEKWFTQKKTATEPKPKTPDSSLALFTMLYGLQGQTWLQGEQVLQVVANVSSSFRGSGGHLFWAQNCL